MLLNYLKIAARKLFKSGRDRSLIYSWINLSGLTIGLTAFLLIGHFVNYELQYDRFYPNHKNIYRLAVERLESGEITMHSAKTHAGIGNILVNEIPEVEKIVRILYEECMFHYESEDIILNRQLTFWADGNFIEFFGLEMLAEGQLELLYKPNQVIISRTAAERFFGADWIQANNPIGKTLLLNGGVPFMIQGVYENIPAYSHMHVDFVVSYSTLMALLGEFMNTVMPPRSNFVYIYMALEKATDIKKLESIINEVIVDHTSDLDDHVSYNFSMQPLTSIHLNSHLSDELSPNGNRLFVAALSIAAILIVVVAWINFINLTIARAMNRSKEVGVRKAIGARKRQLAAQFLVETLFSGFLAALITIAITFGIKNFFNRLTGISIPIFNIQNWQMWLIFLCIFLIGAMLASFYPAMVLSSINPIRALKGKNVTSNRHGFFRQGLILFQFCVAMLLMAGTGGIYHQVNSMRRQSLGVDLDQVLVVHSPRSMIGNTERVLYFKQFSDFLESDGDIHSVASGGCLPGENFLYHAEDVHAEGKDIEINWSFDVASVDEEYLPTLGMELVAGRNFEDRTEEENKVILNQTAIQALGFENPFEAIGKFIRVNQTELMQIVGVVADIHFEGLQSSIKPLLLKYGHDYEFGFFAIKINSDNFSEIISRIETQWKTTYPRDPFEYFFLDNFFDRQYKNDQAFGQLFGSFSLLTIFIAGMGLFGLISYTAYQRSKEIGIRKVMGADVLSIIKLLTVDIIKLILLAATISLPFAHWMISRWLNTFAYRFEPSIWMYSIPLILLLITSIIAVSGQTLKSALSNPVDAIADE